MKSTVISRLKWSLVLVLSVGLLLPFVVLAFYVVPSTDDYMFAYYTDKLGILESVKSFYLTWTGRYSSMFLLSLHPLLVESLILYRLIALIFLLVSGHAIYFFLRKVFELKRGFLTAYVSIIFLFVYISQMPDLVQGFYWLPGSVTYQLSNVLMLYFVGSIFPKLKSGRVAIGWSTGFFHLILILIVCGLSEISFLIINVLIGSMLLFGYVESKKVHGWLLVYMLFAIFSSVVVMTSPGISVREAMDSFDLDKRNVFQNSWNSIVSIIKMTSSWMFSFNLLLLSLLFLIVLSVNRDAYRGSGYQWSSKTAAFGILWGLFMLFVSVFPIHYVFGYITPLRAVNVTFWVFLFLWLFFLLFIHKKMNIKYKRLFAQRVETYVLVCSLLFYAGAGYSSRYYIALNDLVSGRAIEFDRQFKERDRIMRNCNTEVCEFPNFSVFPKTIFNEDVGRTIDSDFALFFAGYYGVIASRATYTKPEFYARFSSNLDSEKEEFNHNWETRTNRVARSGSFSTMVDSSSVYSASMYVPFSQHWLDKVHLLNIVEASVYTLCPSGDCAASLVFNIVDKGGKGLLWRGQTIEHNPGESEIWIETRMYVALPEDLIKKNNGILIYVWNNGSTKVYADDFEIIIY